MHLEFFLNQYLKRSVSFYQTANDISQAVFIGFLHFQLGFLSACYHVTWGACIYVPCII